MSGTIHTQITDDGIGWAVIDNPSKANALSYPMMTQLGEAISAMDADPAVHAIVLRGAGERSFAAGADIGSIDAQASDDRESGDPALEELFHVLMDTSKPIIAMIHGHCIGAGLAIALAADIRIGDERSTFAIPAARLGVGYPVDLTHALVSIVGPGHASTILFEASRFDAERALAMGLLNRIHPAAKLEGAVRETATAIAANAPLTLRAAKLAIRSYSEPSRNEDAEEAVKACWRSKDAVEGPRAFMEKRAPRFTGE